MRRRTLEELTSSTRLEKRKGVVSPCVLSSSVTVCTRLSTSFEAEDDVVIV